MAKTIGVFIIQLIVLAVVVKANENGADGEVPDFFQMTAENIKNMMAQQLVNTFEKENPTVRWKRDGGEAGDESFPRPEFHSSTLRAQASGSGFPSPTMFVGGFSFMMMPAPEGETIFNRIMEALPNVGGQPSGGK